MMHMMNSHQACLTLFFVDYSMLFKGKKNKYFINKMIMKSLILAVMNASEASAELIVYF